MKTPSTYNLTIFETTDALNKAAVEFIIAIAKEAIDKRGRFVIALSGGQTPLNLYSLLATPAISEQINWKQTFIFWGDERCVPLNDKRNNAYMAKDVLLNKIAIPLSNIYPIPVNLTPAKAANAYQHQLSNFWGDAAKQFDLILLGMGNNGHTASLFPQSKVLDEKIAGVKEVYVEKEKMYRITFTAPLINQARNVLFLVTGNQKADMLNTVLNAAKQPHKYPAQLIEPSNGKLWWFVDKEAAILLKKQN